MNKFLLLSCGIFLFGCTTTDQVIERKSYHSWENDIGYSQVVKANNTLYISGITSEESTFENQLDDIYNTIKKILTDYNVGTNAIVKEVIFTTDIEKLKASNTTRKAHFSDRYPASSWVEVKRLWSKSHLLEIEVVVALP
ncbi:RidA family protein [Thalassotalea atypica]|uniref:RidA family protein n=1 Tax=Thalassotalea atypica TaxID=2054316 RepID=UPI002572CEBB|nr:RidA family protein [Thalassotalea atypica]